MMKFSDLTESIRKNCPIITWHVLLFIFQDLLTLVNTWAEQYNKRGKLTFNNLTESTWKVLRQSILTKVKSRFMLFARNKI